jgi:hypothetical protein
MELLERSLFLDALASNTADILLAWLHVARNYLTGPRLLACGPAPG